MSKLKLSNHLFLKIINAIIKLVHIIFVTYQLEFILVIPCFQQYKKTYAKLKLAYVFYL